MFEYESFREEVLRYLYLVLKVHKYTAEDIFHDCYEKYIEKIKIGKIEASWNRKQVAQYIKILCRFHYIQQFTRTKNRTKSKYLDKQITNNTYDESYIFTNIDYKDEDKDNCLVIDLFTKVEPINLYDYNLALNIMDTLPISKYNKGLSKARELHKQMYNMFIEGYSLAEISDILDMDYKTAGVTLFRIKKKVEPRIKELMYG